MDEEARTTRTIEELTRSAGEVFEIARDGGGWLEDGDLVGQVRGLQEAIGALTAAQTVRIAQFAARTIEDGDTGHFPVDKGLGFVDEFASDTLAPMLGMSHGPAATRVFTAAKLAADLPVTLAALAAGDLDLFRAHAIADELREADHDTCAVVEGMIHPRVCGDTPGKARNRVRKALAQIDPDSVRERAARAKLERFVSTRASHLPGMTQWFAQLPVAESAQAWAAIDALAHKYLHEDPTLSLDQCRADALADLILGNATIHASLALAIPVNATAADPASTCPGADSTAGTAPEAFGGPAPDCPAAGSPACESPACGGPACGSPACDGTSARPRGAEWDAIWTKLSPQDPAAEGIELPGIGVIPAALALSMAGDLGVSITRMLINPETGTTIETRATSYRPPQAITTFVRLRDGTCRFPNCSRRAERCELDHLIPWPAGPTAVANLLCLCKHHHRLKHNTRWEPELRADGVVIWTDPYGDQWVTHPADHRQLSPAS
ncbi:DUF222 domain-containing protein [Ornithinimicrobium cryptoxanthini]|uniref:DUF222 domain-containing protein n=1 Tax=Ornithinimicrobium cryptoxanthini TaxID=2934161 RepID=A0ABY4YKR3_9MICO|nr:DUF222 domain-containing protein [Ornithinimicrobium cryptoxanthini]USQ76923.1 DUF222 domain-containing protein [Ornithinimicrobium cryptoxanthini]